MKNFLRAAAAMAALAALFSAPAVADDKSPAAAQAEERILTIGDPAPKMDIAEWVKGEPVKAFEPGKVYVVEFWATWCGPCIRSMPHLTELQKQYKDKGVTVIGVTSEDPGNTLEAVNKMVADKGDTMSYTVAWDNARNTSANFMEAARQRGIPTSFVVDQQGKIAYIGHPMSLDEPLAKIVAGEWDPAAAKAQKDREERLNASMTEFAEAAQSGEGAKAMQLAKALFEGDAKDESGALNWIAWVIVDPESPITEKDYAFAVKVAERASELEKGKSAEILDTLAHAYAGAGDLAKAVATQEQAVAAADDEEMKKQLAESLEKFKSRLGKGGE
ncbi:MAG: redoxin family protein [Candidatus Sumerlaeia bacterium]|nr:redoxin family protein [Candidatus Sumerlaeia bacterium]